MWLAERLRELRDRFNPHGIIGRVGYRTPAQHRRELLVEAAWMTASRCLRNRIRYTATRGSFLPCRGILT